MLDYRRFIEDNFDIVNKKLELVPFKLNPIQFKYIEEDMSNQDIILKARQEGFSSLIDAKITTDFILQEHSYGVIVADIDENAEILLSRVKTFISSYEAKNKIKLPMKYETRTMLYNSFMDSRLTIGSAKNTDFGRSRTISNLHLSEVAFYPDISRLMAGAGQAVIEGGYTVLETTANGFNEFRQVYSDAKIGKTGFKALFYKASDFYSKEFLDAKRNSLGRLFPQEYPETDIECFLSSGSCYFDTEALSRHYKNTVEPIMDGIWA